MKTWPPGFALMAAARRFELRESCPRSAPASEIGQGQQAGAINGNRNLVLSAFPFISD